MPSLDDLQKSHEERLGSVLRELRGRGDESDLALVRALIHRAVHVAAEQKNVEFCALATYLAEMVTHAHRLQHGSDPGEAHRDGLH